MIRTLASINADPASSEYPYGNVRDSDLNQDGTALYTILFQDIQHNMQYLADKVLREAPDNTIDGELPQLPGAIHNYQLVDAIASLIANVSAGIYSDRYGKTILCSSISDNIETTNGQLTEDLPSFDRVIPFTNGFTPSNQFWGYDLRNNVFAKGNNGFFTGFQLRDNTGRLYEVVTSNLQDADVITAGRGRFWIKARDGLYRLDIESNNSITLINDSINASNITDGATSYRSSGGLADHTVFILVASTKTVYKYQSSLSATLNYTGISGVNAQSIAWVKERKLIVLAYTNGVVQVLNENDLSLVREFQTPDIQISASALPNFIITWSRRSLDNFPMRAYDYDGNFLGDIFIPLDQGSFSFSTNNKIVQMPGGLYVQNKDNLFYSPRNFSFK